jgi:hypothetical protein
MTVVRRRGLLLVSILFVAACSGSRHHPTSTPVDAASPSGTSSVGSAITGHLVAVGGVQAGNRPLSGRVEVVGPDATWRDVTVRADGAFRIPTPPGTYMLTGTSPLYNSGRAVCRADRPVVVTSGQVVTADVFCLEK